MNTYIGIDLGTSAIKLLLVDSLGNILSECSYEYGVQSPMPLWNEQEPSVWLTALESGIRTLLSGQDRRSVRGMAIGGQMHGLVILDKADKIIRPCILWNDGRSASQAAYLNEKIGKAKLTEWTGNIAFAGFTAPKLLWMRQNEPEKFGRIAKIMLPKDYLTYQLSGEFVTDLSDASGTLLLDVKNRKWSTPMMVLCGVNEGQLPKLHESADPIGHLSASWADKLGLSKDVVIAAGAGDNAAAAVGTGTISEGACNISLGTSGTVFLSTHSFRAEAESALHSFCHADGGYHLMGCILSAASCRKWWLEGILSKSDYLIDDIEAANAESGELIFLPYLVGERSPHNDVDARGAFIGLSASTTKAQMSRAVMEGVTFALRDCLESIGELCGRPTEATLCGGGAQSRVWRQIVADVFNLPIRLPATEQGPSFGAAMLAMVACGEYSSLAEAAGKIVYMTETVMPFAERAKRYEEKYKIFRALYPALKAIR